MALDKPSKAITIEPFLQEVVIKPGRSSVPFAIEVINHSSSSYSFRAKAVDFGSLDQSGGVLFSGTNAPDLLRRYGLSKWLRLDDSVRTIAPKARLTLRPKIENRRDLSPGGHYAAVVLSSVSRRGAARAAKVDFNQNISALIFAKKTGAVDYGLELLSINDDHRLLTTASAVNLKFRSSGNVHVMPRGLVEITDPFGKLIGKGTINVESGWILPETERLYRVPLTIMGSAFVPGAYHIRVSYRYDGRDSFFQKNQNFGYLGWPAAVLLMASLAWVVRRAYYAY